MLSVLHICSDYLNTNLYNLLFTSLQENDVNNIVYIPSKQIKCAEKKYRLDFLGKDFNVFDRLLFFRKQYVIFNDLINRKYITNINIIHAHNLFSGGYVAYLLNKKFDIPYIVAIRNTDVNVFFKYMIHLRDLGVNIMKNASSVIFISPAYKEYVFSKYISSEDKDYILKKTIVIPNGINTIFITNLYCRNRPIGNKIRLLYVGEVVKNKNIETTICSCKELIKKGYSVSFAIVGNIKNNKYSDLLKQCDFVEYHPFCSQNQIIEYMREADIFVMPSITETFGLVYIEAMSQGMPIIYSKGQGVDGFFREGEVGYSVNCFDHVEIAERIIDVKNNYISISNKCTRYANMFKWQGVSMKYKDIYQSFNK